MTHFLEKHALTVVSVGYVHGVCIYMYNVPATECKTTVVSFEHF